MHICMFVRTLRAVACPQHIALLCPEHYDCDNCQPNAFYSARIFGSVSALHQKDRNFKEYNTPDKSRLT